MTGGRDTLYLGFCVWQEEGEVTLIPWAVTGGDDPQTLTCDGRADIAQTGENASFFLEPAWSRSRHASTGGIGADPPERQSHPLCSWAESACSIRVPR